MNNDMSKCSNSACFLKDNCLRWTYISTNPDQQSYHRFVPQSIDYCENQIKGQQSAGDIESTKK